MEVDIDEDDLCEPADRPLAKLRTDLIDLGRLTGLPALVMGYGKKGCLLYTSDAADE